MLLNKEVEAEAQEVGEHVADGMDRHLPAPEIENDREVPAWFDYGECVHGQLTTCHFSWGLAHTFAQYFSSLNIPAIGGLD